LLLRRVGFGVGLVGRSFARWTQEGHWRDQQHDRREDDGPPVLGSDASERLLKEPLLGPQGQHQQADEIDREPEKVREQRQHGHALLLKAHEQRVVAHDGRSQQEHGNDVERHVESQVRRLHRVRHQIQQHDASRAHDASELSHEHRATDDGELIDQ